MSTTDRTLKLIVVGDPFVGKTCLLHSYTEQKFIDEYEPTVFQNYAASVTINRRSYELNLFDTTGKENMSKIRTISYRNADVVILCFSMIDPASLESCRRWIVEIRKHAKNAHILMIGLKEDLINISPPGQLVDRKLAQRMAEELECSKFLTCSALTLRGLKRVFDEALHLAATGQTIDAKPQMHWGSICCSFF